MSEALSDPPPCADLPRVTIAISALGEGAFGISLPPAQRGLEYLVLVQGLRPDQALPDFDRSDTRAVRLEGLGLSRSRNAALAQCRARYLLVSDEDLLLEPAGIEALADALDRAPELDFVAGWRRAQRQARGGRLPAEHRIRWYKAGHICAPEFMLRIEAVRAKKLLFDTEFGVGARYPIGEDFIFIRDLLKAGLRGRALPVVTGHHPGASSGARWDTPHLLEARRAMLRRAFGNWHLILRVLYALKLRRHLGGWRGALRFIRG